MKILRQCSGLKADRARKPDTVSAQRRMALKISGRSVFLLFHFCVLFSFLPLQSFAEGSPNGAPNGAPNGENPGADTRKRDAALSRTLLEGARNAISLGYMLEAIELIDESIEYSPANSDALYLRALCGLSLKEPQAQLGLLLEGALSGNEFFYYAREDALLLYSSFLVHTRDYHDALRFLSALRHSPKRDSLEAEALRLSGNPEKARESLLMLIGRYPSEAALCIPWLFSLNHETRSAADAKLVAELFRLLPGIKEKSPDFLAALVPFASTLEDSRFMLREFRAMGGSSAGSTVLSLKYGLVAEADAITEFFSGVYPLFADVVRDFYGNLGSDQSQQSFLKTFLAFSGTIAADDNRDGIADFLVQYESGQALSAIVDQNQDDVAEIRVFFTDGVPSQAKSRSVSQDVELSYGLWPYLATVSYTSPLGGKMYSVKPSALAYRILDFDVLGRYQGRAVMLYGNSAIPLLLEQQVLSQAVHVSEKTPRKIQTADLIDGMPVQSWYSLHTGMAAKVFYTNGMPESEQVDLNGDGRFEGRKYWALNSAGESIPVSIEIDANADGIYEYLESLVAPFEKSWDLDDNGSMDLKLIPQDEGHRRYEFSSRLNSTVDIVLVYASGRISKAFRNDISISLVPDAGGKVIWLGKKPFDFGVEVPKPGWGVRASLRYFVLAVGDLLYAEVLD